MAEDYIQCCKNKDLNGWNIKAYHASKALLNAYVRYVLSKQIKPN